MLTKLIIRNFKRFDEVEIELGNPVVFVGPNNSGKTTALQALALWELAIRRWNERRGGKDVPKERPSVAINRKDLINAPIPYADLLWRNLKLHDTKSVAGKRETKKVPIEVTVHGIDGEGEWHYGFQFSWENEESFYCVPAGLTGDTDSDTGPIPRSALDIHIAFLQPMSGLAQVEPRYDIGYLNVLIGEGRTAEVLRNLCFQLLQTPEGADRWRTVQRQMESQFGELPEDPNYDAGRGAITMGYRNRDGASLDLSSAGRGFLQSLLLMTYLETNPRTVILLDEPDAHLEILRQREMYNLLVQAAQDAASQIIIASHSEVILHEAANRPDDKIIAFLGRPHSIKSKIAQLRKSLVDVSFDQYYQAEQVGWVLYVEDETDLSMLKAFAAHLQHPAQGLLNRPFVKYVGNLPKIAREHYYALLEAKPELKGMVLSDHDAPVPDPVDQKLAHYRWNRREFENYLCQPETLLAYIAELQKRQGQQASLFDASASGWTDIMGECIRGRVPPRAYRDREDSWWTSMKATDAFLDLVLQDFSVVTHQALLLRKSEYYKLARFVRPADISPEIASVLDKIVETANNT